MNGDALDGCELDFHAYPTADDDVDVLVLFADIDWTDPDAVAQREAEWRELFG